MRELTYVVMPSHIIAAYVLTFTPEKLMIDFASGTWFWPRLRWVFYGDPYYLFKTYKLSWWRRTWNRVI